MFACVQPLCGLCFHPSSYFERINKKLSATFLKTRTNDVGVFSLSLSLSTHIE